MKGLAQKGKTAVSTASGQSNTGAQSRRRTGAANRLRADGLERQADDLATRLMRGEHNLGSRIGHTTAAKVCGTRHSVGHSLPRGIRTELELSLGADLSAVRIHQGNVADIATRHYDAEAFTSGRDVYFRQGRYAPGTRSGRELLAHELVHVLQQTGRVNSRGLLTATSVQGTAEIQTKRTSPLTSSTKIPTFEEMSARHLKANGSDKTLDKKVKQITKERDDAVKNNRLDSYWDDLQQFVRSTPPEYDFTSPITVRSFIYDTLKLAGRWDGAVHLLATDPELQTTYYSSEAFENFPEGAVPGADKVDYNDYLLIIWEKHPFFKDFRQKRFLASISEYLVGPTRAIPDLEAQKGEFDKRVSDKLAERNEPTTLIDSEIFFVTVDTVQKLDQIRRQKLGELVQRTGKGKPSSQLTPKERQLVADDFARWARSVGADPARSAEVNGTLKRLSEQMAVTAEAASTFWKISSNLLYLSKEDIQLKGIGDVTAGLKKFAKQPNVIQLGEVVVEQAKNLFKLDAENNPLSPELYVAAREEFIAKLREKLFERFEKPLLAEWRSDKPDGTLIALLYGWLLLQIYDLIELLQSYDPAEDARLLAEYVKIAADYKGADVRVRHRIRVAYFLAQFGGPLGWNALQPVLERVTTPASTEKTLLAIFSDFEKDSSATLDTLTKDLAGPLLVGGEPITVGDIRLFFYLERYKTIAEDLKSSLKAEEQNPGSQKYGLVQRATELGNKLPEPVKYTNSDVFAAIREDDKEMFSPLLRAHPKFLALLSKLTVNGVAPILLTPVGFVHPLIVWAIPPLETMKALIGRYQGIKEFNYAIYEYEMLMAGNEPAKDPDLSSIASRPWNKWLVSFQLMIRTNYPWFDQNLDPELRQFYIEQEQSFLSAAAGARKKLSGEVDLQYAETVQLLKKASIIDRQKKLAELRILLGDYQRYDQFSKGDETHLLRFLIPDELYDQITGTVAATQPKEDQPLHQAALLLELADLMADKFQDSPRFDVMVAFLPLMEQATELSRNQLDALKSVLTGTEKDDDWIKKRADKLDALGRLFHATQQQKQLEFGLQGVVAGPEKYLVGVGEGYVIKPGEEFTIEGVKYTLVKVLTNFVYYPKHGTEPPLLKDGNEKPLKVSTPLVELRYGDSTKSVTLKGTDNDDLTQLSNAVTLEGIKRQLDDLATYIQGFAELTMDIIEMIPGPGQALMAARLAMSIIQFVASDEFAVFVDYVTNHPVEALKKFGEEILTLLNPNMLWEYLFFGNNAFDQLHNTKEAPKNAKVPRTVTQKLVKVIMRLYNFGKGVLGSLGRLQTHTRWRAESLEMFVLGRPTLNWVVRKLADNIDFISGIVGEAIDVGSNIDDYRKRAESALTEWPKKVIETVDTLRKFELPDEIVPVADIVEIIITMVLKRLPTKFRIASDVIMFLLDKFGKKQALFDTIADGVKQIGVDPNAAWREVRDEYIKAPFQAARNELAFTIFDLFGRIPTTVPGVSADTFALMTADQQKMFQDKAKEAQADTGLDVESVKVDQWDAFAPAGIQAGALALGQVRSEGVRLPGALRGPAERGLGQPLGHVRLHTGAEANQLTQSIGARALAGGSHVFLGAGVNPATPSGRWVLNHELAHVAQQTSGRRLGGDSSPIPVPRGRGVVQDPIAESFASRAADTISSSRSNRVGSIPKTKEGFHPLNIVDVTRRLLDDLAGTTDLEKDEKKEEKSGGSTGLKKIPPNIKKQIDKLWTDFGSTLADDNKTTFTAPFHQVKSEIRSLLTSTSDTEKVAKAIEEAIGDLAIDAVREKKEKPAKEGDPPKITYELDIDRLEIALSRFVFAKSGILIKFKLLSGIFAGAANQAKDAPPSFVTLNVVYVHLAEIHGNHKLWQLAVNTVLLGKDHDKYLPRLRAYIEGKGPVLGIWDKANYQITKQVVDDVEAIMTAIGSTLDKNQLPSPSEYVAPKMPSGAAVNVGLRLGTYGDTEQTGPERESHHITQYLLLEYFYGKSDKKPFPLSKKSKSIYPGVTVTGSGEQARADKVIAPGAPKAIDLVGFEEHRGGKMPAILLAAYTHRTGRLHVTTKADDFTSGGNKSAAPDSPAGVVDMKFHQHLDKHDTDYRKAQEKSEGSGLPTQETFAAYVARKDGKSAGHVSKVIYNAMQDTYHWMRDFMQPRLKDALVTAETKYYDDLGKSKGYSLGTTQLDLVYAEAVIKNRQEMERGGWF
jgi:hypothetical protein